MASESRSDNCRRSMLHRCKLRAKEQCPLWGKTQLGGLQQVRLLAQNARMWKSLTRLPEWQRFPQDMAVIKCLYSLILGFLRENSVLVDVYWFSVNWAIPAPRSRHPQSPSSHLCYAHHLPGGLPIGSLLLSHRDLSLYTTSRVRIQAPTAPTVPPSPRQSILAQPAWLNGP